MEIDLSKRPEGATHCNIAPYDSDRTYDWMKADGANWYSFDGRLWIMQWKPFPDKRDTLIKLPPAKTGDGAEQIQEGIDDADAGRLKSLSEVKAKYVWDGEGLPPEGPLEYKSNDGWRLGECVAIRDGYAVIWVNCGNLFAVSEHDKGALRPIRTPEQIAAEERKRALIELTTGSSHPELIRWAEHAYDTLCYRKQVEE